LIDAYRAEAIPVADLKHRQEALAVEQREAQRLIELASVNHALVEERLEIALGLLEHCARLYVGETENARRDLNQAFFSALHVDKDGVTRAVLNPPFAELHDLSIGLADDEDDGGPEDPGRPEDWRDTGLRAEPRRSRETVSGVAGTRLAEREGTRNPEASRPRGSNVTLMAAGVGFEPTGRLAAASGFRSGAGGIRTPGPVETGRLLSRQLQ
jgi:hypothetical protein